MPPTVGKITFDPSSHKALVGMEKKTDWTERSVSRLNSLETACTGRLSPFLATSRPSTLTVNSPRPPLTTSTWVSGSFLSRSATRAACSRMFPQTGHCRITTFFMASPPPGPTTAGDGGRMHLGRRLLPDIVAVHAHVHASYRDRMPPNILQDFSQTARQVNAPALHPNDAHAMAVVVSFRDLVPDARENAMDRRCV